MKKIELNADELEEMLDYTIKNNQFIQEDSGDIPVTFQIEGESGLGKTSIASQVAKKHNLTFVKKNLAQLEELGDLVGFPIRQFEMLAPTNKTRKNEEGKTVRVAERKWVDENAVEHIIKMGGKLLGPNRTSHCPPDWIASAGEGGILLLDDWNRCDQRFTQAVMELLDRQEYYSWKLPKNWHIILTANPDDGNYLVTTQDDAQATRYISMNLKWDVDPWAKWAEYNKTDSRCINFTLMHPEIISSRVNPRALVTFFKSIKSIKDFEEKSSLARIQKLAESSIGPEAGTMFTSFIANRFDKMILPHEILLNPDTEYVKRAMKEAISGEGFGEEGGGNYRNDIASILTARIYNYALSFAKDNPITDEVTERIMMFVTEPDILTNDLTYVLVKKLVAGNKQKFKKLAAYPKIQEIILE